MKTFAILTLGCKVNAYESEWYTQQLESSGLTKVDFKDRADIYIINTCAVTNVAEAKSRQKINAARKNNPNAILCVVGCYIQAKLSEGKVLADVDIVIGTSGKKKLPELVLNYDKNKIIEYQSDISNLTIDNMPLQQFNQQRAYLKIQDGCNQYCTYCIIPYARGSQRNMPVNTVIDNARKLVNAGHLELVLTGIHTGRYQDGEYDLAKLIELILEEVKGLRRLRISSIEVTEVTDELLELIACSERVAKHLHIPLQTGNDEILKLMHRPYSVKYFKERIEAIREKVPGISISTDVIVGFPNETEVLFDETSKFIEDIEFSFLHVFPFSVKNGTEAEQMTAQVNGVEKKKRARDLTVLSSRLYNTYKRNMINEEVVVFFETYKGRTLSGYSSEYVNINVLSDIDLTKEFHSVKITHFGSDELWGELV